jgi:hypothetical protein
LASTISAGNGTLVGYRAVEQPYVWNARWNAGTVYYPGSDQTAGALVWRFSLVKRPEQATARIT